MAEKKVVLVTGGSGLVGQAIRTVINEEQQQKTGISQNETWIFCGSKDADLRDKAQTDALFEKHKPTHVIHLAAMVGGLFHNMANNLAFFIWCPVARGRSKFHNILDIANKLVELCYATNEHQSVGWSICMEGMVVLS